MEKYCCRIVFLSPVCTYLQRDYTGKGTAGWCCGAGVWDRKWWEEEERCVQARPWEDGSPHPWAGLQHWSWGCSQVLFKKAQHGSHVEARVSRTFKQPWKNRWGFKAVKAKRRKGAWGLWEGQQDYTQEMRKAEESTVTQALDLHDKLKMSCSLDVILHNHFLRFLSGLLS